MEDVYTDKRFVKSLYKLMYDLHNVFLKRGQPKGEVPIRRAEKGQLKNVPEVKFRLPKADVLSEEGLLIKNILVKT